MRASDVKVYTPVGVASSVTTAGAASTAAVALPVGALRIMFSATEGFAAVFGGSDVAASVVATCMPYQADTDYVFDVPGGVTHYTAIRTGGSDAVISMVAVG